MGGTQRSGQVELGCNHVDGDDLVGSGDTRTLDRREADTTAADHGDGLARCDLGGAEHGSHTGGDAAADQRRTIEGHVLVDLHHGVFVDQHHLGVGATGAGTGDRFAACTTQTGGLTGLANEFGVLVLADD